MALNFDAAHLVNEGSGIVYIVVGLVIAIVGRARKANVWLGVAVAAFGVPFVAFNLTNQDAQLVVPGLMVSALAFLASAAAFIAAALTFPRPMHATRLAVLAGLAAVALPAAAFWPQPVDGVAEDWGVLQQAATFFHWTAPSILVATGALLFFGFMAALRVRAGEEAGAARGLAIATGGMALYVAYNGAIFGFQPGVLQWMGVAQIATLFLLTGFWLAASARRSGQVARDARSVALVPPALALVVGVLLAAKVEVGAGYGVVRTVGGALVLVGILRYGLLGPHAETRTVRRSTLAAGALALLFIVAQVAQNIFSAQYGLLTGGVVAGVFLFAASPIQRAMEGLTTSKGGQAASAASRGKDDAYRAALRFALRDGSLSAQGRVELARVADGLGLTAGRAAELEAELQG